MMHRVWIRFFFAAFFLLLVPIASANPQLFDKSGYWYSGRQGFEIRDFAERVELRYTVYNDYGNATFYGVYDATDPYQEHFTGRLRATQRYHDGSVCVVLYRSNLTFFSNDRAVQQVTGSNGACNVPRSMGWTVHLQR